MIPGSTHLIGGIVTTLEPAPPSRHVHGHMGYRDTLKALKGTCLSSSCPSSLVMHAVPAIHQPIRPSTAAAPASLPVPQAAPPSASSLSHVPAIAAMTAPPVAGPLGSRIAIAATSDPAKQLAFARKAESVFKLTAPKQIALKQSAPKPSEPRRRRPATGTGTKGSKTVPTSFSSSDSSSSSTRQVQHGDISVFTEEDDCSLGGWAEEELVEGDVIAAMQELAEEDAMASAMHVLAEGDDITAAMQQLAEDDGLAP